MKKLKLISISGLPGSGKSTVAEGLAETLAVPLLSVDPIESAILIAGIPKSFETGLAAYEVAEILAREQLKLGISAIIDAVNPVQEARNMWIKLAQTQNVDLILIECFLERDIHRQRIEARTRNIPGIPEVTWADVEERRNNYLPWKEERLVLDTSGTREDILKKALEYIQLKEANSEF